MWVYGHYINIFNFCSAGIDFRRQNLTSVDIRLQRLRRQVSLKDLCVLRSSVIEPRSLARCTNAIFSEHFCETFFLRLHDLTLWKEWAGIFNHHQEMCTAHSLNFLHKCSLTDTRILSGPKIFLYYFNSKMAWMAEATGKLLEFCVTSVDCHHTHVVIIIYPSSHRKLPKPYFSRGISYQGIIPYQSVYQRWASASNCNGFFCH